MSRQQDANYLIARYLEYVAWWVREGAEAFETWKAEERRARAQARSDAMLAGADPKEAEAATRGFHVAFEPPGKIEEPEDIDAIIQGPDPDAWDLLQKLVSSAPNDPAILGFIGAGFFEDWIQKPHGEQTITDLLERIRHDSKWRVVAETCWHNPPRIAELLRSL